MYPKKYHDHYESIMKNCTRTQVWLYARSCAALTSTGWYRYFLTRQVVEGWDRDPDSYIWMRELRRHGLIA